VLTRRKLQDFKVGRLELALGQKPLGLLQRGKRLSEIQPPLNQSFEEFLNWLLQSVGENYSGALTRTASAWSVSEVGRSRVARTLVSTTIKAVPDSG
jgi:hypothetical protein